MAGAAAGDLVQSLFVARLGVHMYYRGAGNGGRVTFGPLSPPLLWIGSHRVPRSEGLDRYVSIQNRPKDEKKRT